MGCVEGVCMGACKLTYENYMENIDYWLGEKKVKLPLWANELADYGFRSVSAIDFYDDIFGEDLEPSRLPEDYKSGEYGGIAIELLPKKKKDVQSSFKARRITITKGNSELYDLIEASENFCMIAPLSYCGKARTNKNARYLYAMVIEIDNIVQKNGIAELVHTWNRKRLALPKPTYIVCSGTGVHLYFVFERPIPLFAGIFESLSQGKSHFTKLFWNKYITISYNDDEIQYESINQPFRCVGSVTKKGNSYVIAFEVGNKVTIEYLNRFLPKNKQMNGIYKSKLSLDEAKALYPEWYQRRIVEKKDRGHFYRYRGIYDNWIEKIKDGAIVGKRYNCLENLCSLAVQCRIEPNELEEDCRMIAEIFEGMTISEENHFTEYDVICALKTYHNPTDRAFRRKIEYISNKTGIKLEPNKRNDRKQQQHIKMVNATRKFRREVLGEDEYANSGRPSAEQTVQNWQKNNPTGKKADCIRETGLSKPTVYKWWVSTD